MPPAWLRPIGRVFPRVVIDHAGPVIVSHALHVAAQLAQNADVGPSAAAVECQGADDDDSETFSSLSVRSLSGLSGRSGLSGFYDDQQGLSDIGVDTAYEDAFAYRVEEEEPRERTYEASVQFITQAEADATHRRHVTGEGVYHFPRFASAAEERRAQKAPRRACIELGETAFAFGTVACDGEVELTFLGHRVARTSRGDFNARVERRGNALLAVAVDQILVFREIIVDGSWMDDL